MNCWRLVCSLLVLIVIALPDATAQNSYYTFDGNSVRRIDNVDPSTVSAGEWQIWLYRRGEHADGIHKGWGLISENSSMRAMRALERGQAFEKAYEKFCRCGADPETYFNPLGPIAVVKPIPVPPSIKSYLDKFSNAEYYVSQCIALFAKLNSLAETLAGADYHPTHFTGAPENNPFRGFGTSLGEYADSLHKASQQLTRARNLVNQSSMEDSGYVLSQLRAANDPVFDLVRKTISGTFSGSAPPDWQKQWSAVAGKSVTADGVELDMSGAEIWAINRNSDDVAVLIWDGQNLSCLIYLEPNHGGGCGAAKTPSSVTFQVAQLAPQKRTTPSIQLRDTVPLFNCTVDGVTKPCNQ